ncbi:MAG: sulfite exporter TauE/SafE family protein [Burkholderiaceae bacterium]
MSVAALLAFGFVVFVFGGVVKGTLGVGLPLVAVPLMSLAIPATQSIALVMMPVLVSNIWQAFEGGLSWQGVRRFAPLIVALLLSTLVTVPLTLDLPEATLRALLAGVVLLAVALMALPLHLSVAPAHERWWSMGVGAMSGVLGGVSSLTGPIIITYMLSLRLARDVFVGSISIIYLAGALPLYGSMAAHGRVSATDAMLSVAALLPMALGLLIGRRVRSRLSERWFRRILLGFLVGVALLLLLR